MNPGYIKGYVPGVRENGGQYSMPPSGRRWHLPKWGIARKRGTVEPY